MHELLRGIKIAETESGMVVARVWEGEIEKLRQRPRGSEQRKWGRERGKEEERQRWVGTQARWE